MGALNGLWRAKRGAAIVEGKLAAAPPALGRLTVGYVFATTGWGKLHNLDKVTDFFASLSIPAPAFHATFVSWIELLCGSLLLLGLATRVAAIPLIGTMVVALSTALAADIEDLSGLFGTVEFTYIVILLWLAMRGPGAASLDHCLAPLLSHKFSRRRMSTLTPTTP